MVWKVHKIYGSFCLSEEQFRSCIIPKKKKRQGKITALFIYIDDIVVMENYYE
jgi:hypothetical protein